MKTPRLGRIWSAVSISRFSVPQPTGNKIRRAGAPSSTSICFNIFLRFAEYSSAWYSSDDCPPPLPPLFASAVVMAITSGQSSCTANIAPGKESELLSIWRPGVANRPGPATVPASIAPGKGIELMFIWRPALANRLSLANPHPADFLSTSLYLWHHMK